MSKTRDRLAAATAEVQKAWQDTEARLRVYLPRINVNFQDFTLHDERHFLALENILDWLAVPEVWPELNDYELFVLLCAIWSHDVGMGATLDEACHFATVVGLHPPDDTTLRSFLRDNHPGISRQIIVSIVDANADAVISSLAHACGEIAASHGSAALEQLPPMFPVGVAGHTVRPLFLAMLLRLADVLHCTADRAPYQLFKIRAISNPTSVAHWRSHQATIGVGPDHNVRAIKIHIVAKDVISFAWAMAYRDTIQKELDYCAMLCTKLNLHSTKFGMFAYQCVATAETPFIDEVVRINVDATAAISTLVGRHIYDDHSVVIRELLQNAIDACSLRRNREPEYIPQIILNYDSSVRTLKVTDNGIGMNLEELKSCLFRSCTSGFRRNADTDALFAKFGIGFLSVFMVAERTVVRTRRYDVGATDGYIAVLTSPNDPIDIRLAAAFPVGTTVELTLKLEIALKIEEIRKWLPDRGLGDIVDALYDGVRVTPQAVSSGAAEGLELLKGEFETITDDFHVRLRPTIVIEEDGNGMPCGLSFQGADGVDRRITELPHVHSRFFLNGIPFVMKGGQRPTFSFPEKKDPVIDRVFAPFDVDFVKPGLLELNLARNQIVDIQANRTILEHAGTGVLRLISECYSQYKSRVIDAGTFAARFIGEYWLTRLESRGPADPQECLEYYRAIWGDVRVCLLNRHLQFEQLPLNDSKLCANPVILIRKQFLKRFTADDVRRVVRTVEAILGLQARIAVGLACDKPLRYSLAELLFSIARSLAMFDTLAFGLNQAPVYVFDINCPQPFPQMPCSYPVFGTESLFVGELPRGEATGVITGGSRPQIVLNSRSHSYTAELASIIANATNHHVPVPRGETPENWLRKLGIPNSVLTPDNIHPSLTANYPCVGFVVLPGIP